MNVNSAGRAVHSLTLGTTFPFVAASVSEWKGWT